ncbi:MAG: crotonase/enoyl-CoA hydratase family protein [Sphingobium sp.]
MTDKPDVDVTEEDGILILTLDRPEARNAATLAASIIIAEALDELDARDDLRVAIITGANNTFCTGMDLKKFMQGERPTIEGRGFLGLTIKPPKKPLIAAVEGYALAGGFETALACDLIVAARGAKFGLPEVKRGLMAMAGGLIRLPRQMPQRLAMELALTGDMIDAEQAHRFGLINQLVDDGCALAAAMDLARRIAANAPLSIVATKEVMTASREWPAGSMFAEQENFRARVFSSNDAREGAMAFAEKRAPQWTGS